MAMESALWWQAVSPCPYMRVDYRDSKDPDAVYGQGADLEGLRYVLPAGD